MLLFALLLAQESAAPANQGNPPLWPTILMCGVLGIFAYIFLILPSSRQEKQRKALIAGVKRNDRILNSGGIIGIVDSIKDGEEEVVLRGGLRITKSSIVRVLTGEEPAKEKAAGA